MPHPDPSLDYECGYFKCQHKMSEHGPFGCTRQETHLKFPCACRQFNTPAYCNRNRHGLCSLNRGHAGDCTRPMLRTRAVLVSDHDREDLENDRRELERDLYRGGP